MNFKAHIIIGIAVAALCMVGIFSSEITVRYVFVMAAVAFIYSILPDVDHKMSKITWMFLGICCVLFNAFVVFQKKEIFYSALILFDIVFICAEFVPHRGPTHTIQAAILSPLLLFPLLGVGYYHIYFIAGLCYYGHLVADGLPFKIKLAPQVSQ